jgi:hypothetical protein
MCTSINIGTQGSPWKQQATHTHMRFCLLAVYWAGSRPTRGARRCEPTSHTNKTLINHQASIDMKQHMVTGMHAQVAICIAHKDGWPHCPTLLGCTAHHIIPQR